MKNTTRTFVKKISFALFGAAAFLLPSCNIGLGEALDLKGPTVAINSPEARETVKENFDISGTVTDDSAVGTLTVTVDENVWEHGDSGWRFKAKGSSDFVADDKSKWVSSDGGKSVNWTVKDARINSPAGGTYTIDVSAIDKSGNKSAESHKSRDVIIDKSAPNITISSPVLKENSSDFGSITNYQDITKISLFRIGDFTVSGKTTDENAIKYVDLIIKSETGDTEYFKIRLLQDESYKGDATNYKVVDSLRSWDVDIILADCALKDLDENKHVLKILTETEDVAGNKKTLFSQGYTCLWKAADKPWIEMNLGSQSSPLNVYAESSILGNAYDDTAIKEVTATIRETSSTGLIVEDYDNKLLYKAKDGEEENNAFIELKVPKDCKTYYVEVTAKDDKGKEADKKTGYFAVLDKTYPSVEIEHYAGSTKKEVSDTLFGDSGGNFKFKLMAKDDTAITSLKMVYITNPADVVSYSNKDYGNWNTTVTDKTQLKNGKVLNLALPTTTTTENDNGFIKKVYTVNLDLNIFNDLGINGDTRTLSNQTFVFRVQDGNNNALTKEYTVAGDINPPTITFTGIQYGGKTYNASYKNALPAFGDTAYVTVSGKISDDSSVWGYGKLKEKFTLKANGTKLPQAAITVNNDGTFTVTTKDYATLEGTSLIFDAELKDYANNTAIEKLSYTVDSQQPKVEYISATNVDGCYKVGDTIYIYIYFNKLFTLNKGSSGMPTLTLNTGRTVEMIENGDGFKSLYTNQFGFKYKIEATDTDVEKLKVTGYDLKSCKISDSTTDQTTTLDAQLNSLVKGNNLASVKDICIITKNPALADINFVESTGTLTLTYNKKIAKGSGDVTISQLKSDKTVGIDRVPAVISETDYKALGSSALDTYYESSTNGASEAFEADLNPKYVLKYQYDSNNADVISAYKATGVYKLSKNIKGKGITISSDGKTVTVDFGKYPLPCKGATYKIEVDDGFVQDAKGGDAFPALGTSVENTSLANDKKSYSASGIATPFIRINKTSTIVGSDYKAVQPDKTQFKIDCETLGVNLTYSYDVYKGKSVTVTGIPNSEGTIDRVETSTKDTGLSITNIDYTGAVNIGTDVREGLQYNITAKVTSKTNSSLTASNYEVAYRTVIQINKIGMMSNGKLTTQNYIEYKKDDNGDFVYEKDKDGNIIEEDGQPKKIISLQVKSEWPVGTYPNVGLFIRGGTDIAGANSVNGLPTDWDTAHTTKVCLMTQIPDAVSDSNDNYYFSSWAITTNYYFKFIAGLMDSKTISDSKGVSQGPLWGVYSQNHWVGTYSRHYVSPGGTAIVYDNDICDFELQTAGKSQKYRN